MRLLLAPGPNERFEAGHQRGDIKIVADQYARDWLPSEPTALLRMR